VKILVTEVLDVTGCSLVLVSDVLF